VALICHFYENRTKSLDTEKMEEVNKIQDLGQLWVKATVQLDRPHYDKPLAGKVLRTDRKTWS